MVYLRRPREEEGHDEEGEEEGHDEEGEEEGHDEEGPCSRVRSLNMESSDRTFALDSDFKDGWIRIRTCVSRVHRLRAFRNRVF